MPKNDGNPSFMSISQMQNLSKSSYFIFLETSRKDDLESIFYTLMIMIKGNLPWNCKKLNNEEILRKK